METMNRIEFSKLEAMKKVRSNITAAGVICYVAAAFSLVIGLLDGNFFVLIDVAALIVLGLLIQLKLSFPASIVLLVYSVINTILSIVMGRPGGWLVVLVSAYAVYFGNKLNKAYKEYQATGMLPA